MEIENGILAVSLDFELYWGMRDKKTIQKYENNLRGVRNAIGRMLELFEKFEIHATWATVGALFAQDIEELKRLSPRKKPRYRNANLNPYDYMQKRDILETCYHFAPELVEEICKYENQEIGTHTFSHYYCLENGQTANEFDGDIESAIKIAKTKGISINSFVFPRNQCNSEYLSVLQEHGIISYRGNEKGWLYKAVNETEEKSIRRALRLMDAYVNLSGTNSYSIMSIDTTKPYNIRSSRFLRPVSKRLFIFEGLRKRRIVSAVKHAAKNGEVFHLWWHPHNFGINTDENINLLESILSSYEEMRKRYGMKSLNMGEIGKLVADNGKS